MELDELKKTWKALDERLPKQPLADERQIEELISRYKAGTGHGLRKLIGVQRFSLWLGVGILGVCIVLGIIGCLYIEHTGIRNKVIGTLLFILFSLVLAMGWDYKTLRWIRAIRIDEMSVAEVSRRMVKLRHWMKYEVAVVAVWCIAYTFFNWWIVGGFGHTAFVQGIYFTVCFVLDLILISVFYKKCVYKHLNNIKANIEELEDVCTE